MMAQVRTLHNPGWGEGAAATTSPTLGQEIFWLMVVGDVELDIFICL
jgi:hypothetical protein